jgi:activating signal cointegrator complex subunit 1
LEEELSQLREQGSTVAFADDEDDDPQASLARSQADEIMDLRRQLADMKRNISMSTRMDAQVTDSVVGQETGVLHHELQNWIVNNFRKAKGDVAPQELCSRLEGMGLTPGQRHQLRPMYAGFTAANKLVMYQATAVCLLMDIFTDESLFGLPHELAWKEPLYKALSGLELTLSPAAHNKLRAVTFDVIRQNEGTQELVMPAAKHLAERICSILTTLTEVDGNGNRLAALTSIVRRAIDLQHLFRAQRARYQFDLPSTSDVFHAAVMDNIAVDEESPIDFSSRIVKAATWPSLIKIGDEFGDNVHFTNVIVKAKVVCS